MMEMDDKHFIEAGDAFRIEWTGHGWSFFRESKVGGRLISMTDFKTFDEAVEAIRVGYVLPSV